ncbi:HipA domain-containing protein [Pseudorhodoferax sp.]|uniref:HipA domain-containing protein n=1 Tax=Pseudorhodoferax sp. TaxID=1993553 RepID=UPI0039E70195
MHLHGGKLHRFFLQVAFFVMVRNGDAHLKNCEVLCRPDEDLWLAPMFEVVTASIYEYTRYQGGGPPLEDRTLALKLFAGRHQARTYFFAEEFHDFGCPICGVTRPAQVLAAIAHAMEHTLPEARSDGADAGRSA